MKSLHELSPGSKEFKMECGSQLKNLSGCIALLERLLDEFPDDKKKRIVFNPVFVYLDSKVSNWIGRIYGRGGEVGEKKLERYGRIADRVEVMANGTIYDSELIRKLRIEKDNFLRDIKTILPANEAAARYEEKIMVKMVGDLID